VLSAQLQALTALMAQLDAQAQQSNARLLASQERFQGQAEAAYRALATSVDQSLQRSLADGARLAATTLQPAVQATLAGITRETAALHGHVASTVQQQLDSLVQRLEQRSAAWVHTMGEQAQQQSAALLQSLQQTQARQHDEASARDAQRLAAWAEALHATAAAVQREWQLAGTQAQDQQAQICATLEQTASRISAQAEAHARSTIAEVSRLVQTASEAPRAAAEVVAQLREKLSDSMQRDNTMLEERSQLMATLNTLLGSVQHTAGAQKAAVDELVAASAAWLDKAGSRFTEKMDTESARMDAVASQLAAQLAGSAVEVASLGEAFGAAVALFSASSGQLTAQLQQVQTALAKSTTRSDEQLAYYVAQAREVIDLSLLSQKQIVDELQRVAPQRTAMAAEA